MEFTSVTVKLPTGLHRKVKATAAIHGLAFRALVIHSLELALDAMREEGLQVADET